MPQRRLLRNGMDASQTSGGPEWERLDKLFQNAMDLAPSERDAFIKESCGDDLALHTELSSLLNAASDDDRFLTDPLRETAYSVVSQPAVKTFAAGSTFGRYVILAEAGSGGMGKVYVAEDPTLKRRLALKILTAATAFDPDSVRRFRKEAEAASALNHPNILTIYEVGECQETQFIASEFIEGRTIRQCLSSGSIQLSAVLDVAIQIASGLAVAHEAGLIHRDIKPENIIIRSDGLVKIVDFGIARFTRKRTDYFDAPSEASSLDAKTGFGLVIGTTRYMSPEQARGQKLDARTDIFSLGAVLYEMICGHSAFEGDSDSDLIAAILKTDPPALATFLPRLPTELIHIVNKTMCKDRATRYSDAKDLLADLRAFRADIDFQQRLHASPGFDNEVKSQRHFNQTYLVVAVIAALLLGALAWRLLNPVAPGAPAVRTLAILPFRNNHPDSATDFLGYSLADAVITKMSYVSSVNVRPSSSVDRYRNQSVDPQQAGAQLNVGILLVGSYLKDGDDLRINTQLVDVKHDKILWRDSFDVKYDKLLTVQDRVAAQIIAGLELNLSPAEEGNLRFDNPIRGPTYEQYLRGVDLYALADSAGSITTLEAATKSDPQYALAWAHLGQAYATHASQQFGGREQYTEALAAYQHALQLNPALIEPQIFIANLLTDTGKAEEAVPVLQAALKGNRNNAEAHWELGYAYRFGGLLAESLKEGQLARELDPQVKLNSSAMNTFLYLGRYSDFLNSLPARQSAYILFYRGFGEYYQGNLTAALKYFDDSYALDANLLQAETGKAIALAIRHQNAEGLKLLADTERKIQERGVSDAEGIYKVAQAYAVLHDNDSALRLLKQTVEHGFFPYPYFEADPLIASVRSEPGYRYIADIAKARYLRFRAANGLPLPENALPQ